MLTHQHPYTIVDKCNNHAVVMSGSEYAGNFEIYCHSENLLLCKYTAEIKDSYGNGIPGAGQGNGFFKVFCDDDEIESFGKFEQSATYTWGYCLLTNC